MKPPPEAQWKWSCGIVVFFSLSKLELVFLFPSSSFSSCLGWKQIESGAKITGLVKYPRNHLDASFRFWIKGLRIIVERDSSIIITSYYRALRALD
jgi:hypothetical protein